MKHAHFVLAAPICIAALLIPTMSAVGEDPERKCNEFLFRKCGNDPNCPKDKRNEYDWCMKDLERQREEARQDREDKRREEAKRKDPTKPYFPGYHSPPSPMRKE